MTQQLDTKVCKKCGVDKDVDRFVKCKNTKDGLYYYCKDCTKVINADYYKRNTQERIDAAKTWKEKNPETEKAVAKASAKKNRKK